MKISARGLKELIQEFEGYHAKQADGSCRAYKCPAGVWTCGWGCTEGVNQHTQWTKAEAEEALAREMAKHEANVERLVRVPLNQGQFDSLVSLCYNVGVGNLSKSSLLKHLNSGDYARAASHFADWKYSTVADPKLAMAMKVKPGQKAVLPGLVKRRAAEAAMFLEAVPEVGMVQRVDPPRVKVSLWAQIKGAFAAIGSVGIIGALDGFDASMIPAPPAGIKQTVTNLGQWGDAVPWQQWQMLLVGAAVFAAVAGGSAVVSRLK
jgi:GH24 family phage-related lysozyme (muramidase)